MRIYGGRGFTLIELIVVLAVVATLVTVGIPSYQNLIQDNRLTINSNMLVISLALARTESIKRGVPVTLCASTSGSNCTDSNWENGWIVFTDNGAAGQVDADDIVLRVQSALGGGMKISFAGATYLRYRPTGMISVGCDPCFDTSKVAARPVNPSFARSWVSKILLALLPIRDAMASGGGMTGSGSDGGSDSGHHGDGNSSGGMTGSDSDGGSDSGHHGDGNSGGGMMGSGSDGGSDSGHHGDGNSSGGDPSGSGGSGGSGSGGSGSGDSGSGGGGSSGGVAASAFSGTFILCDETRTSETGRVIEISPTGRVRIAPAPCN